MNFFNNRTRFLAATKCKQYNFMVSALFMFLPPLSVNAESVRLVLSHQLIEQENTEAATDTISENSLIQSQSVQLQSTQAQSIPSINSSAQYRIEDRCVTTLDGLSEICVPVKVREHSASYVGISSVQSTNTSSNTLVGNENNSASTPFSVVNLETGESDLETTIATLENTGWFASVEEDRKVYTATASSTLNSTIVTAAPLYNDPDFFSQTYLFSAESELSGSDFISLMVAKEANVNEQTAIGVAILDSGFYEIDEVLFEDGYSFVASNGSEPQPDFYSVVVEGETPCIAHGTGVASVIGAQTNNGKNMVGAAGNVELHALEVMSCGTGFLSDVANALNALAGIAGDNYPAYEHAHKIKIANLSLGLQGSTGCSSFMQDAINNVKDANILVVVSDGNSREDVSTFEPANCENVVVVAALDENADLASFSNSGSQVDVSAQGTDIFGMNYDGLSSYLWEGTSFSAPLVTSAATYIYRENPEITPEVAELLIKLTSREIQGDNCDTNNCGSGLLNVAAMSELAAQVSGEGSNKITYMLSDKSTCDQEWYMNHFGSSIPLCNTLKLTFSGSLTNSQFFGLYQVPINNPSNESLIQENIKSNTLYMAKNDLDFSTYIYLVKICDEAGCYTSLPIDPSDITNTTNSPICS